MSSAIFSWWKRLGILAFCGFLVWILMGCSTLDGEQEEEAAKEESEVVDENRSVEDLYNDAADTFSQKSYVKAMGLFEEVERQHPYSDWAKQAQIMAAYSAYRAQDYLSTQIILERFVKLHPNNESTPYAYYLRALSYYDQITDIGRDQNMTEEARQALREVVSRFPGSQYARDAKLKLDLTTDHLAGKEMQIGRYYQKRQEYLAAINRFKYVVDHYQTTSHIPEALHRLVESYLLVGVKEEAQKYAAVLGHNYPGSEWYQYSYAMLDGDVDLARFKKKEKGRLDWLIPSL